MSGIFQHLKPEPSASPGVEDQKAYARMLDLNRSVLAQSGGFDLVQADNGVVVQVPITLPRPGAESDHFDRNYPSSLIPAQGLSPAHLEAKTRALIHGIEGQEMGMGLVNFGVTGNTRKSLQGVALVAGLDLKPMQVGHLGGSAWRVGGGGIVQWPRGQHPVEETDLNISQGWILIPLKITPDVEGGGYDVAVGSLRAVSSYENSPPFRKITLDGDTGGTNLSWQPGDFYIPVAYVVAPGSGGYAAPFILQGIGSPTVRLLNTAYGPGIPLIL